MKTSRQCRSGAFTLRDLLLTIWALLLLAVLIALLLPGHNRGPYSRRAQCVSNLKQVSLAFMIWESDHAQDRLHYRVDVKEGGTFVSPDFHGTLPFSREDRNQAWFQFSWVSNEMNSPKVLVCPADKEKFIPDGWADRSGGFMNPSVRNRAVSYALSLDTGPSGHTGPPIPMRYWTNLGRILLADRNFQTSGTSDTCSSGVGRAAEIKIGPAATNWRQDLVIHGGVGNVALMDASVQTIGSSELNQSIDQYFNDYGVVHFLIP